MRRFCSEAMTEACSRRRQIIVGDAIARRDRRRNRRQQRHPASDEIAGGRVVGKSLHAAAARMAEHDDVLHLQHRRAIFQRRRNAMISGVGRIRRDQIGDVADHEQLTRAGVENHFRRDPGIATADHHRAGRLPAFGEFAIAALLGREAAGAKRCIAVAQSLRQHRHSLTVIGAAARPVGGTWRGFGARKANEQGGPVDVNPSAPQRAVHAGLECPRHREGAHAYGGLHRARPRGLGRARRQGGGARAGDGGGGGGRLWCARGGRAHQWPRYRMVARGRQCGRQGPSQTRSWCRRSPVRAIWKMSPSGSSTSAPTTRSASGR